MYGEQSRAVLLRRDAEHTPRKPPEAMVKWTAASICSLHPLFSGEQATSTWQGSAFRNKLLSFSLKEEFLELGQLIFLHLFHTFSFIDTLKPDYLLILAWNFSDSIINKNRKFHESGGKFIIPMPKFEVI